LRFLADMGVSGSVTEGRKRSGHHVRHLRDEGLHRLRNGEVFVKAAAEMGTVLTFDLDFGEMLALLCDRRVSVILFRLHNTRSAHVIDRLAEVLNESFEPLENGAIVVVDESRHRVRRLPLRPS
jgi:predicted nuclease of predicted toxin-antitoxin system